MIDMGIQLLDLAWSLLGRPKPTTAFAVFNRRFRGALPADVPYDVEDAGFALVKFEGERSLELSASWAINQPPRDNGTKCQVYADKARWWFTIRKGRCSIVDFGPGAKRRKRRSRCPRRCNIMR